LDSDKPVIRTTSLVPKKHDIAVVTHPFHDEVGRATLANLVEVLEPLADEMFLITGDFPDWPSKTIHTTRLKADLHKGMLPTRMIQLALTDVVTSLHLVRISRRTDTVVFYIGTDEHLLSTLTSRLLRKKTVACVPGLFSKTAGKEYNKGIELVARVIERIRFAASDQIAVESPSVARFLGFERYEKKLSATAARYVRTDLFRVERDLASRDNVVGYVGRLVEGKGLAEFVQAMPMVLKKRADARFLVGGGGPLRDQVVNSLRENGLSEEVRLVGWIPHDEVPHCLNDLKLFVLPSEGEGLPGGVQEAMACGAVVLATPVGGVPDLIEDGKTGFILKSNSAECIAETVIKALNHPGLSEIARNGRRLIEQEYGYDAMVEKFRHALNTLHSD
jgi:glycosyltransferase involved in cell wall biosynthesis